MKHLGTRTITTERLILRKFTMDDAQAMYDNWASDHDVTKYLTKPRHESIEDTRTVLADWLCQYEDDGYYQWAIVFKEYGDEPVGNFVVAYKDDRIKMVHVGYCLGKRWWNMGITSEALQAVIDFFFREVRVNRIEARFDPRNPNSGKVMTRCGMSYEGTRREADMSNLGLSDSVMYAILAREYAPTPDDS